MADGNYIFILIMLSYTLMSIQFVNGGRVETMENKVLLMHEGIVKTIQTKDGDMIDCVGINKQPAFNHPLLKNHTIQMKPDVFSRANKIVDNKNILFQSWHEYGECPEGTIPILRTQSYNLPPRRSYPEVLPRNQLNQSLASEFWHEYAQISLADGTYYGARATINIWVPTTEVRELSSAQLWVQSGGGNDLNVLEAGWVAQSDRLTRLFIYWTSDGYQKTGCYNLLCPGFVQTNSKIALGFPLESFSTFGGRQYDIGVTIQKDDGDWWLLIGTESAGYWPRSLFTTLADSATSIKWGGQIRNTRSQGHHTTTQMGSGRFSTEGLGRASYFRDLKYIDDSGASRDPENLYPYVSDPYCYDVAIQSTKDIGVHFFFGGPGYSMNCQ